MGPAAPAPRRAPPPRAPTAVLPARHQPAVAGGAAQHIPRHRLHARVQPCRRHRPAAVPAGAAEEAIDLGHVHAAQLGRQRPAGGAVQLGPKAQHMVLPGRRQPLLHGTPLSPGSLHPARRRGATAPPAALYTHPPTNGRAPYHVVRAARPIGAGGGAGRPAPARGGAANRSGRCGTGGGARRWLPWQRAPRQRAAPAGSGAVGGEGKTPNPPQKAPPRPLRRRSQPS